MFASRKRLPLLLCSAVFFGALAIYLMTLAPTVTLTDSGELILAAYLPGIAHAPGFPLWTMIGWLFAQLPLGRVAVRLNGMSAFFSALAAVVVFALVRETMPALQGQVRRDEKQRRRSKHRSLHRSAGVLSETRRGSALLLVSLSPRLLASLPPLVAALSFAFSLTHWNWATVAEVYALNTCLIAAALTLLLRWRNLTRNEKGAGRRGKGSPPPPISPSPCLPVSPSLPLLWAGLLYGLALGVHHVTVLLLAPAIGYLVIEAGGWQMLRRRAAWLAVAAAALGALLSYLYLPLRAAQEPLLNWGDPSTLERFWWHVTGKQYRVNLFSSPLAVMWADLKRSLALWWRQFTPLGLALAGLGVWALWRRARRLLLAGWLIVLLDIVYTINYHIAQDSDAYLLPTFLVTALWIGWGVWGALAWAGQRGHRAAMAVALLALAFPLLVLGANWKRNDKRAYFIAEDYARNALASVEMGGVIFTDDWQLYSPLWYLQHVEGVRPDVAAIDVLLMQNRSWYFPYLRRTYPWLMEPAATEADGFLAQLDLFEHDRLPEGGGVIGQRYRELFERLLAISHAAGRPVYASRGVLDHWRQHGIHPGGEPVPEGLLFRIYPANPPETPPMPAWQTRGLTDGSVYLDETALQVRQTYAVMALNRGIYLERHGQPDGAAAAYRLAAEFQWSGTSDQ